MALSPCRPRPVRRPHYRGPPFLVCSRTATPSRPALRGGCQGAPGVVPGSLRHVVRPVRLYAPSGPRVARKRMTVEHHRLLNVSTYVHSMTSCRLLVLLIVLLCAEISPTPLRLNIESRLLVASLRIVATPRARTRLHSAPCGCSVRGAAGRCVQRSLRAGAQATPHTRRLLSRRYSRAKRATPLPRDSCASVPHNSHKCSGGRRGP